MILKYAVFCNLRLTYIEYDAKQCKLENVSIILNTKPCIKLYCFKFGINIHIRSVAILSSFSYNAAIKAVSEHVILIIFLPYDIVSLPAVYDNGVWCIIRNLHDAIIKVFCHKLLRRTHKFNDIH